MRIFRSLALLWFLGVPALAQANGSITLTGGWNAVAFPCGSVTAVNGTPSVAGLASFDGTAYQLRSLTPTEINAGEGTRRAFWVFCTGPGSLNYVGTDSPGAGLNLRRGWNLVAFPLSGGTISAGSLSVRRNGAAGVLGQLLLPAFYELATNGQASLVDVAQGGNLRPGRAYWVFSSSDGVTLSFGGTDPLTFSTGVGLSAATAAVRGVGTTLVDTFDPDNPRLDTTRMDALAETTVLLAAGLGVGGSRTVTSALGGTAAVVVTNSTAAITFTNYKTSNATLNGSLSASSAGSLVSGTFTATATFTGLTVAVNGAATYQFDGTSELVRTRTQLPGPAAGIDASSTFTANFTAADVSGPYLRYDNLVVTTRSRTNLGTASVAGTQACTGTVSFQNYQGTTGRVVVSTPADLAFSGSLTGFQVTSGQVVLTGLGAMRLTVTAPNLVEVAVQLPGTPAFITVGTFTWTALAG